MTEQANLRTQLEKLRLRNTVSGWDMFLAVLADAWIKGKLLPKEEVTHPDISQYVSIDRYLALEAECDRYRAAYETLLSDRRPVEI